MNSTNYFSSIVKILENPEKILSPKNIYITKFRVELPQTRQNKLIHLVFRGKLADSTENYYHINDYILIEGYLSIKKTQINTISGKSLNKIEMNVIKIYPLYLN